MDVQLDKFYQFVKVEGGAFDGHDALEIKSDDETVDDIEQTTYMYSASPVAVGISPSPSNIPSADHDASSIATLRNVYIYPVKSCSAFEVRHHCLEHYRVFIKGVMYEKHILWYR